MRPFVQLAAGRGRELYPLSPDLDKDGGKGL